MNILVVEDDTLISDAICKILSDAGFFADAVYDGGDAIYYAENQSYDLIILDIMLPVCDGIEVLKTIRQKNISTPVLMLTAKNTVPDKVSGLNTGADDYMTKPFDPDELLARVNALTRRKGEIIIENLKYGDLTLLLNSAELCRGDLRIRLTKKEFEILRLIFKNPDITLTKENIIVKVWGADSDATENNVEAYISFIRKKIKYLNSCVLIKNIQGIGYRAEVKND